MVFLGAIKQHARTDMQLRMEKMQTAKSRRHAETGRGEGVDGGQGGRGEKLTAEQQFSDSHCGEFSKLKILL